MATVKRKKVPLRKIVISIDEPLYSISVASRLTEIPVWTLRVLDRKCIVCPKKSEGQTRLYSNRDVNRLNVIHYYIKVKKVNIGGLQVLKELKEIEE